MKYGMYDVNVGTRERDEKKVARPAGQSDAVSDWLGEEGRL